MSFRPWQRPSAPAELGNHEDRLRALERRDDCCIPTGVPSLADTILGLTGLGSFWKLNESTGLVAADSGPNGYDLTALVAPNWGQAAGPPGEQAAGFDDTPHNARLLRTGISMLGSGDMTVLIWAYRGDNSENPVIGSGEPFTTNRGWQLAIEAFNRNTNNKATLTVGSGAGAFEIEGTTTVTVGTWVFLAATHTSGTWRLYVDGAEEGTAITTVMTAPAVPNYWIGNNSTTQFSGRGSYGAVLSTALTAAEIANLQTVAGLAGTTALGMVLTNPGGDGDPYWAYPTIEVTY